VYFASIALFSVAFSANLAESAIVEFSSKPLWQAAAGPTSFTEDFNGFSFDTPFRIGPGPLTLNGFTLVELGPDSKGTNLIDLPPLINTSNDVNGTPFASIAIDFAKTIVELRFLQPTRAFGADFRNVDSPEETVFDFYQSDGSLITSINPTPEDDFIGYVATSGESLAYVRFRTTREAGEFIIEAFGMDNVVVVAIPEPSSALLAVSIFALLATRRSRR
jgi:hypothetical protein